MTSAAERSVDAALLSQLLGELRQKQLLLCEVAPALVAALSLLPKYSDPAWDEQPDDVRCDVDYARQVLARAERSIGPEARAIL